MKRLPIGISNFREIVEEGYAYVDKSGLVYQLAESGKYYFLFRPGDSANPCLSTPSRRPLKGTGTCSGGCSSMIIGTGTNGIS